MKQGNQDGLLLGFGLGALAALGGALLTRHRGRGRRIRPELPLHGPVATPNPAPARNVSIIFHAVYRNPQTNKWEVAPKLSNLYNLGKFQTVVWRIIGDPEYFFPASAFSLDEIDADRQFSQAVHGKADKRILLLNVANDVEGKHSYTLRVQKPGGEIELVDPGFHTGPTN